MSPTGDEFSDIERAAMKDRAAELRAAGKSAKGDDETAVLALVAEMDVADRELATRLHGLIRAAVPSLTCRTWYGMPAYAKDGKVLCFFQSGKKFKTRYCTFGFSDVAALDDGSFWPTGFALTDLTPAVEKRIVALVTAAAG